MIENEFEWFFATLFRCLSFHYLDFMIKYQHKFTNIITIFFRYDKWFWKSNVLSKKKTLSCTDAEELMDSGGSVLPTLALILSKAKWMNHFKYDSFVIEKQNYDQMIFWWWREYSIINSLSVIIWSTWHQPIHWHSSCRKWSESNNYLLELINKLLFFTGSTEIN